MPAAPGDDKRPPAQETPEGHPVRLNHHGRVTRLTAVNAKWLLDRDGGLIATLCDAASFASVAARSPASSSRTPCSSRDSRYRGARI